MPRSRHPTQQQERQNEQHKSNVDEERYDTSGRFGMTDYREFLESRVKKFIACGFEPKEINPMLFDFQKDIVRWAIRKGRAAIWADCGLGKSPMQLQWADQVSGHTNKPILIFAPLAVCEQTVDEGVKFGVHVTLCESQKDIRDGVNITNYEKLAKFKPDGLAGVVLDESGILKGLDGVTRKALTEFASKLPYRLACTATPAPNDYMELGTHAEFLGVMTTVEMLATFFVHDGGDMAGIRRSGVLRSTPRRISGIGSAHGQSRFASRLTWATRTMDLYCQNCDCIKSPSKARSQKGICSRSKHRR